MNCTAMCAHGAIRDVQEIEKLIESGDEHPSLYAL